MKNSAVYLKDPVSGDTTLINLFEDEAFIGTAAPNTILINDFRCNGVHAYLTKSDKGDYYLVDLGSTAGTFYNGQRVRSAHIKSGDTIVLGNTHLLVKKIPEAMLKFQTLFPHMHGDVAGMEEKKIPRASLITERELLQASLYWGQQLIEVKTFSSNSTITIGSEKGATFGVTLPESNFYKLAVYREGKLVLDLPAEATGFVWLGDDVYTVDTLRGREQRENGGLTASLRVGDRADIQIGEMTLSFKFVEPPENLKRFVMPRLDKNLFKILLGVIGTYFLIFLVVVLAPAEKEEDKKPEVSKRLKRIVYNAGVKSGKIKAKSAIGQILSEEGGRAKGESGVASKKTTPKPSESKQTPSPKVVEKAAPTPSPAVPTIARPSKQIQASITSAFKEMETVSLADSSALTGKENSGNTVTALASGNFARGSSGLGSGGGGESVGIGQLKGISTGGGMGAGDTGVIASKGREIEVGYEEQVELLDGLDSDVIAAVIKRYLPQIQHCYESRLVVKPDLKGKVQVAFQIIGSGQVRSPKVLESTMNDLPVEKCILEKIAKWQFPKPRGGGSVDVKYPFLLMSTNGQ